MKTNVTKTKVEMKVSELIYPGSQYEHWKATEVRTEDSLITIPGGRCIAESLLLANRVKAIGTCLLQ